jgi:hypothetical protein
MTQRAIVLALVAPLHVGGAIGSPDNLFSVHRRKTMRKPYKTTNDCVAALASALIAIAGWPTLANARDPGGHVAGEAAS